MTDMDHIHSAAFRQPQGPLNPMGARMNGEHLIEIFQPDGSRKWRARIAGGRVIDHAENHENPIRARQAVARLFEEQTTPWKLDGQVDPNAELAHFHIDPDTPSLCGSRYHVGRTEGAVIILPWLRSSNQQLGRKVCAVCLSIIDRTPQPGDKVGTLAGAFGQVKAALTKGFVIAWEDGTETQVPPGDVRPLFLEQFR